MILDKVNSDDYPSVCSALAINDIIRICILLGNGRSAEIDLAPYGEEDLHVTYYDDYDTFYDSWNCKKKTDESIVQRVIEYVGEFVGEKELSCMKETSVDIVAPRPVRVWKWDTTVSLRGKAFLIRFGEIYLNQRWGTSLQIPDDFREKHVICKGYDLDGNKLIFTDTREEVCVSAEQVAKGEITLIPMVPCV